MFLHVNECFWLIFMLEEDGWLHYPMVRLSGEGSILLMVEPEILYFVAIFWLWRLFAVFIWLIEMFIEYTLFWFRILVVIESRSEADIDIFYLFLVGGWCLILIECFLGLLLELPRLTLMDWFSKTRTRTYELARTVLFMLTATIGLVLVMIGGQFLKRTVELLKSWLTLLL